MGLTYDEVRMIKKDFSEDIFHKDPYSKYMNTCGISKISIMVDEEDIDLKKDETLDDFCISVGFEAEPPKDMMFPSEYKGIRIFYKTVGRIELL